ncbi:MAG TPA: ElyC/SanA/YdcF family protein [Streptosporangiaceae bacterium]
MTGLRKTIEGTARRWLSGLVRLYARPVVRRWGLAVAAVAAVVIAAPTVWAFVSSGPYRHTASGVPARGVAIVFGAGVQGATPSPFLARRLDIARGLYAARKVRAILVTGDNSTTAYDETSVMRDYLTARGVPRGRVVSDYAGFRTWDSCARARRIFGVRSAIVVTQAFHLPRALVLCRAAGIDAVGVGDDSFTREPGPTAYGYAREVPADIRALIDVWTRPDPRFLGPYDPGVDRALR